MRLLAPATTVARVAIVLLAVGCVAPALAADPALWTESAEAQAAPELARFDELLSQLAERLKPELVLALGHPFGLEQTVSFGIVSRKGAPLSVAAPGFDFIQTDAAINPGNSGGPLGNMAGEVTGVNSMAARNGSIGFAIPSNLVQQLVPQLATKGRVEWGWLGVSIGEVTEADLERLKLREPRGVLVRDVMPGEPAELGGVRANDVIVEFDGAALEGPRDLQRAVSTTPVGKRVRVTVLRDGRETEVEVTVGLYQERETPRPERPRPPPPPDEPKPDVPRPDAPKEPTE